MTKYIILLGPPGAGKGTQAKRLAQRLGYFYFGMGDLLRDEAKKATALGQKVQAIWDKGQGELVGEELIEEFIEKKINQIKSQKGIVFDGVPRTLKQAEKIENFIGNINQNLKVINLEANNDLLIKRIQTRKVCPQCGRIFFQPERLGIKKCYCGGELIQRDEDKADVFQKRLAVYYEQTKPLIDNYQNKGILINIDGNPTIEVVWQKILEILDLK